MTTEAPRRPRLGPGQARVRLAVRRALAGLTPLAGGAAPGDGPLVLVALSGGPDSLALAAAAAFEAPRAGLRAGAIVVDHGLQEGSRAVAAAAAAEAERLGLAPVLVRAVRIDPRDPAGPEGAARAARYGGFRDALAESGAEAVLLGHTLDDQAETVLLGLARGSGARSLSGMAPRSGPFLRPLLGIRRATTRLACAEAGLDPWLDPHNADRGFARVRVREEILPLMEELLGPGVSEALARTAALARDDADALDRWAAAALAQARAAAGPGEQAEIRLSVPSLAALPPAVRGRVIRRAGAELGATLSRTHVTEVERLVTAWRGQGPLDVPGARVERVDGSLSLRRREAQADRAGAAERADGEPDSEN